MPAPTTTAPATRLAAIGFLLLAMLSFAVQDTVVKVLAEEVSLWQLQAVRSFGVVLLLAGVLAATSRLALLRPGPIGWPLARSLTMSLAYVLFYGSLPFLSLSQAAAAFYVGPLFITLLAALLMGEPVGPRRLAAVAAGFAGVLLILRPWSAFWQPAMLMPLGAALCYAFGMVLTRWRCRDRPGTALTFVHNLVYLAQGLAAIGLAALVWPAAEAPGDFRFMLSGWLPVGAAAVLLMLGTAVSHLVGMLASIRAYQSDEASRLAPYEYSYLAIIPVFDVAIWGRVPDGSTLVGMTMIAAAGIVVGLPDRRPARHAAVPPAG